MVKVLTKFSHPSSYEIAGIEQIIQPDDITCGPTSTVMLLNRYGKDATIKDVEAKSKTKWFTYKGEHIGMTVPDYIPIAMKHFGVEAKLTHANLDQLKYWVSQNKPCIVLLRSGPKTWHYVLVYGFNEETISVADPVSGRVHMPVKYFESSWRFKTDMDGVEVRLSCPVCNGAGSWGWFFCAVCGGSGLQPDYIGNMLYAADIQPLSVVVPYEPVP